MQLVNFSLAQSTPRHQIIEVNYLGEELDLHNAAEFLKFEYAVGTRTLTLFWNYYYEDGANIVPFQMEFSHVNDFSVLPRDPEIPINEDDCLKEIIFNERFILRFMGGREISVDAESCKLFM